MCQEPNDLDDDDWDDDDWDEDDLDWDDEWDQPQEEREMKPIPEKSKVALIGVVFCYDNDEQPWLVQDNRKALKNEFPCRAKADVLNKVAEILNDMCNPPSKLDQDSDPAEVTVAVTLQASLCDLENQVNILDLRRAAAEAVGNAVPHHEETGFDHFLADIVSLGVVEVRTFSVE